MCDDIPMNYERQRDDLRTKEAEIRDLRKQLESARQAANYNEYRIGIWKDRSARLVDYLHAVQKAQLEERPTPDVVLENIESLIDEIEAETRG